MVLASGSSSTESFTALLSSMPGFRFHPTDEELVMYYLKRKMRRKRMKLDVICDIDVSQWEPEDLPGLSVLKTGDRQWFFLSPRDRKYHGGATARSNRATTHGFWKATGKDRSVTCNSLAVGVKKTLVYYRGKASNSERTDWVMHEYTMDEEELCRCQDVQDYYALYKVFKKSGLGPKNGEHYGAPFREEDWADDDFVESNVNSSDGQQLNEACPVDAVTASGLVQPFSDDEVEDNMQRVMDDESVLDLHVNGHSAAPQVITENTQSSVVDQFSDVVTFPDPSRMLVSNGQPCSFDLTHAVASHLHVCQALDITSSPNTQREECHLSVDDFLEIDDFIDPVPISLNLEEPVDDMRVEDGLYYLINPEPVNVEEPVQNLQFEDGLGDLFNPEPVENLQFQRDKLHFRADGFLEIDDIIDPVPTSLNVEEPPENRKFEDGLDNLIDPEHTSLNVEELVENLQFEDGLSELDLHHDVEMFLHDTGPVGQEANPYRNIFESNTVNQNHQLLPNQEHVNQTDGEFWMHGQTNILNPGEDSASFSLPTSGMVCESASSPTEGNENQGSTSNFSSALWDFVHSIPSPPASACENALVNLNCKQILSLSSVKINIKPTDVIGNDTAATMKIANRTAVLFHFFPVICCFICFLLRFYGIFKISREMHLLNV